MLRAEHSSSRYGSSVVVPLYIKAIHGHSGTRRVAHIHDADWEILPRHTPHVYHSGYSTNLDSILRNGLLAGGPSRDQKRHQCYFSIGDPRRCNHAVTGRPLRQEGRHNRPIYEVSDYPYPADPDMDAIYVVETQRCNELGIQFWQNPTTAVLCNSNIPPECISRVIDFMGHELYVNKTLNSIAPGDRKASIDIGPQIQRASVYVQLHTGVSE